MRRSHSYLVPMSPVWSPWDPGKTDRDGNRGGRGRDREEGRACGNGALRPKPVAGSIQEPSRLLAGRPHTLQAAPVPQDVPKHPGTEPPASNLPLPSPLGRPSDLALDTGVPGMDQEGHTPATAAQPGQAYPQRAEKRLQRATQGQRITHPHPHPSRLPKGSRGAAGT